MITSGVGCCTEVNLGIRMVFRLICSGPHNAVNSFLARTVNDRLQE